MMRPITAGTSYMGQDPAEAHFGLGPAPIVDAVVVEFPDGSRVELMNVDANQVLVVTPKNDSPPFTRADANGDGDGDIDVSDSIRIFQFLFLGAPKPLCLDAYDSNDDGSVEITDGIHLLDRLFRRHPEPGDELTRSCASDATADALTYSSYKSCP